MKLVFNRFQNKGTKRVLLKLGSIVLTVLFLALPIQRATATPPSDLLACAHEVAGVGAHQAKPLVAPDFLRPWLKLNEHVESAKTVAQILRLNMGESEVIQDDLLRQRNFIIDSARPLLNAVGTKNWGRLLRGLTRVRSLIEEALRTSQVSYKNLWMINLMTEQIADLHFSIHTHDPIRPEETLNTLTRLLNEIDQLSDSRFLFYRLEFALEKRWGSRLESNSLKVVEANALMDKLPIPLFDVRLDLFQFNELARHTKLRIREIMSGSEIEKNGIKSFSLMIDGSSSSPSLTGAHDEGHFSFSESTSDTQKLGEFIFEGSGKESATHLVALNVLYFVAWHESRLPTGHEGSSMFLDWGYDDILNRMHDKEDLGADPRVFQAASVFPEAFNAVKLKWEKQMGSAAH